MARLADSAAADGSECQTHETLDHDASSSPGLRQLSGVLMIAACIAPAFATTNSTWRGDSLTHTAIEAMSVILALVVGALALVRYYSKKKISFLLVGCGFLGTAALDAFHGVSTASFMNVPESQIAIRLPGAGAPQSFLGVLLFLRCF